VKKSTLRSISVTTIFGVLHRGTYRKDAENMATVRKRSWETKDGTAKVSWLVDYRDAEGNRRFETFTRQKDAKARLNDIVSELKLGIHTANSSSMTLAAAAKLWLDAGATRNERATMRNYKDYVDRHIQPLLGRYKLSKLTVPVIAAFRDRLLEKTSPTTTRKVLIALKGILKKAKLDGLVAQNNASDVTVEERKRDKRKLEVGRDIPSVEEVNTILANAAGRWRPFFVTAVFGGLRSSELRGLRWSDVELDKRVLHVRQRADRWGTIGMPKSEAGQRKLPLSPSVVNALRDWKLRCPKSEAGLVFPTTVGTPMLHSNICNLWFYPLQRKLGIVDDTGRHKYGLHALRHFYASWLIDQNFAPKKIQTWLGHASITMTFDTYGHLMPSDEDDHEKLATAELRIVG
jgi:integrase